MYLSRLYIENYKSIGKIDLQFKKGRNVIVGRNNAGKSNIIKAIDLVLGSNSPTWKKSENITDNDFFKAETNKEIFIWCELTKEPGEVIDFASIQTAAIFRIQSDGDGYRIDANAPGDSKDEIFFYCGEDGEAALDERNTKLWIGGKRYCKRTFEEEFEDKHNFAFAFRCKKIGNEFEKDMVFLYREDTSKYWLMSLSANLREVLLQSAVVPPFRDPRSQLNTSGWGWYGKLLRHFIKDDNPDLTEAFKGVKEASEKVFAELQKKIFDSEISIAFPGTKISFQFNPDAKQDIHKSTLIYVDDGFNSQLQDKGSGIQSAVIIGLFDYYTREIAHASGSSLLAIEEPELYLHPHGRRLISDRIDAFIDGDKNQVILTTHSSEFVSVIEGQNIIVVRKEASRTDAKMIQFDSPKRKQILIKKQNAELFFADAVVLVEGAEKYFIEYISKELGEKVYTEKDAKLGGNWMDERNISIINCGGKDEFWKYVEVLKELSISYIIISDFDFITRGLSEYLTNLGRPDALRTELNTLKSQCNLKASNSIKSLSQLAATDRPKLEKLMDKFLAEENIYLLNGELEDYYKIKPTHSKEQGVIETISGMIETSKPTSDYLDTSEFEKALRHFIEHTLKVTLVSS